MASVHIFSIHDHAGPVITFDLQDILVALAPMLERWTWFVYGVETFEESAMWLASCTWLSSYALSATAGNSQTIEGTFIAFPRTVDTDSVLPTEYGGADFPTSRAELMIIAIDSSYFEVYAKDSRVGDLLRRHFKDVREEDPALYF